ncbi:MAG: hypothetical protein CENE_00295 [Candidatus Celerinatantimonas neptuna]|nr:MAG: hypothetical protein CENE_00295 [Candidatus Celerinatantimonas neptuna]
MMKNVLLGTVTTIILSYSLSSFAAKAPTPSPINLNQATAAQLETLPGIGSVKAKAIISYRKQHGAFKNLSQLSAVKGIGLKLIAREKGQLIIK